MTPPPSLQFETQWNRPQNSKLKTRSHSHIHDFYKEARIRASFNATDGRNIMNCEWRGEETRSRPFNFQFPQRRSFNWFAKCGKRKLPSKRTNTKIYGDSTKRVTRRSPNVSWCPRWLNEKSHSICQCADYWPVKLNRFDMEHLIEASTSLCRPPHYLSDATLTSRSQHCPQRLFVR